MCGESTASRSTDTLPAELERALWKVREPERASVQQRYMKSSMPFMGVRVPVMRKTARRIFSDRPRSSAMVWQASILEIWRHARYREQRYAAIELLLHRPHSEWLTMERISLLDELIVDGAWWDYVDRIAPAALGHLVRMYPRPLGAHMRLWARDEDIWRRRSAILCQLSCKSDTDLALLYDCLEACFGHDAFFVQKAMGWALRMYAWTDPQEVQRYVRAHAARLSPLTRREALKNLSGVSG